MSWTNILKVRTRKDNKTVIHRQGPQKVEIKTARPNRERRIRTAPDLGTIIDSPEAMTGSDQVNRNIAITERKKELAELRKDPQSRDINSPKYKQAQRLQTMIGNMQAEQQNPVKIPQSGRPVMPEKTPSSPKRNVPLPSSTKPTERVPLPSTKPKEEQQTVPLPKDQYQPPAKWERILNTRPPKPVMPTTSMPEKRPPIKRKVIPSASAKQKAWEKSRLDSAANKLRNKGKEQLTGEVKRILKPPVEERQKKRGPPKKTYTNAEMLARKKQVGDTVNPPVEERQSQKDEVARRIQEEREKSIETARANRARRGPSGPPRGRYATR